MTTIDQAALLTIEDTAARIGITTPALRAMVIRGTAPASARIGRRRYFRARDVDSWIDAVFETEQGRDAR